jgi:hypothetical protein
MAAVLEAPIAALLPDVPSPVVTNEDVGAHVESLQYVSINVQAYPACNKGALAMT